MTHRQPLLESNAIISIAREGGIAFFPGISKPRKILLSAYDDDKRKRILALLNSAAALAVPAAGQGDQRYFRIEIRNEATPNTAANTLLIPEQDATDELTKLWEQATGD